jgi:hypothetical protein
MTALRGRRQHRAARIDHWMILAARANSIRRDRQVERRRALFGLPFVVRLLGDLELGGDGAAVFRTSSPTLCHQCSAGALSSPSSRWRVSVNCESWCHASQSARVRHVPTITRLSGLSAGTRSCPPTQPGRFFAANRRVRMAASQSRPAPSFKCTCVTIVLIGRSPSHLQCNAIGLILSSVRGAGCARLRTDTIGHEADQPSRSG